MPEPTQDAFADQLRIVRVAVPVPLKRLFDYSMATSDLCPAIGARVRVQFGRQNLIGICVAIDPQDPHDAPKPLEAVIDTDPALPEELMQLGQWLADYYHHPLGEVLHSLLPAPGRRGESLTAPPIKGYRILLDSVDLGRAVKQQALHERLAAGPLSRSQLLEEGFSSAVIKALVDRQAIGACDIAADSNPAANAGQQPPLKPSPEQQIAIDRLREQRHGFTATLLEGVTGSGKTEVYLQLIDSVLKDGKQVLMLVPEIALTPQTLERFAARFGHAEALHSQVSDGARVQIWDGCRSGRVRLLIGTRSASLTPFAELGLIVVDEEHDASFKQTDGLRYSARDLAVKRAASADIPLLLGSATPSLETLHNVAKGRYEHLTLTERAGGASFAELKLIDVRGQQLQDGISQDLRRAIAVHLDQGNQVLVFINRRGYSPSLICGACGSAVNCGDCDTALTYHRHTDSSAVEQLICHHCGLRQPTPSACPACAMTALIPVGVGTQRSEAALAELFPQVPLYRIDRDTARSKARLAAHFAAIRRGKPAILVGTQILAKGHHFPNVTLVAMLGADAGFAAADFRAPERTAQLIIQVAGRAGRAERPGEVWIQTLQCEHPLLAALLRSGYPGFAAQELQRRAEAGLPPHSVMALVRAEATDGRAAEHLLSLLKAKLTQALSQQIDNSPQLEIMGPVPAPMARVGGRYRFQLLLLANQRRPLHRALTLLEHLAQDSEAIKAARNVRWSIDVDPYDSL
ncbi:MAG: primosomal protein N' [Pseudomonadales bacterium]